MVAHYDFRLVVLSILIAIMAAHAALDLTSRIASARPRLRPVWLTGGSVALGSGIWAMHSIAMEAFRLPVPLAFDWRWVLVSFGAVISASWVALFFASRASLNSWRAAVGSVAMGAVIAGMHYIRMYAMRVPAILVYSPILVAFSVLVAVVFSFAALRLTFTLRDPIETGVVRRACGAVLIGLAISSTHYMGMAAVRFAAAPGAAANQSHAMSVSALGLISIVLSALVVMALALVASSVDRRVSLQARALASSRRELDNVFNAMTEAMVVLDAKGTVLQLNRAAREMFELPPAPFPREVRSRVVELLSPDGTPLPRELYPSALGARGDFRQNYEVVLRRKDTGKTLFTEVDILQIVDPRGAPFDLLLTFRDISERKQLDAARTLVAAVVESSEDAIIGRNLDGVVTSWNKGAEKVFGYTAEEMVGRSTNLLVPPDRQSEEDEILEHIRRGDVVEHIETTRLRKDGHPIHISLTISPIKDGWGKIVGASKVARDITAIKHLESRLRQSQKMDAIGQLTGGIAHDFNNLLGVIIGNLELVQMLVPENAAALKRLHTAMKAANRGADLTRRLLAFSSIDELRPAPTDLAHSARNMLELAGRVIGPEIEVVTDFSRDIPQVLVDPSGLETALLNLVVNARDAMPQGGILTIKTQLCDLAEASPPVKAGNLRADTYACVSVSDNGSGMTQEVIERAFEPFFTTKHMGKGTGLGLAMVYGFARQSGGTARIYSEFGRGTTVTLYLPLVGAAATRPAPKTHTAVAPMAGVALAVDDELDLLDIAATYLSDLGYTVLRAEDGTSAVEILQQRSDIDLIVTDIIMPGDVDGVELAAKAREVIPDIKVVYSSGFPAGALEERSKPSIDGPLLHKPYNRQDFNSVIADLMTEERPASDGRA